MKRIDEIVKRIEEIVSREPDRAFFYDELAAELNVSENKIRHACIRLWKAGKILRVEFNDSGGYKTQ